MGEKNSDQLDDTAETHRDVTGGADAQLKVFTNNNSAHVKLLKTAFLA